MKYLPSPAFVIAVVALLICLGSQASGTDHRPAHASKKTVVKGPRGPRGRTGARGPAGPPGTVGAQGVQGPVNRGHLVDRSGAALTLAPGEQGHAQANCQTSPPPETSVSGGWDVSPKTADTDVRIFNQHRFEHGWSVDALNHGTTTATIVVTVSCLQAGYSLMG